MRDPSGAPGSDESGDTDDTGDLGDLDDPGDLAADRAAATAALIAAEPQLVGQLVDASGVVDLPPKPLLRGWSHVVAFGGFAVLGTLLVALPDVTALQRTWLSIYVLGTVAMLGVSSLYHRLQWSPAARSIVRRLDHSTIFLAIAGAYTPVVGAALSGWRRPTVLIVAWTGAVVGITLQWVRIHVPRAVSTAVYVVVGWSSALGFTQLIHVLGGLGFGLLLAGGLAYTIGAVVYAAKWPDPWPRVFGFHEVFHLCTIVGVGCHLATIAFVVVPEF